jgi:hypothetical protein
LSSCLEPVGSIFLGVPGGALDRCIASALA